LSAVRLATIVVFALVLAACGGSGTDAVSTTAPPTTSSVPITPPTTVTAGESTTTVGTSEDETSTTRPDPNPDRDLAPDFSLTLSDGTEYQLANETRPVYMVFWAEW
jgi:hypothetical protein